MNTSDKFPTKKPAAAAAGQDVAAEWPRVEDLLAHYYDGEATADEEQQLEDRLAAPDAPAETAADRRLLRALAAVRETAAPPLDTARLERQIDQWERVETASRRRTLRLSWRWLAAAAACIALAFTLPALFQTPAPAETAWQDTYDDPERAAEEAQRALARFSECIGKGLAQVEKL